MPAIARMALLQVGPNAETKNVVHSTNGYRITEARKHAA